MRQILLINAKTRKPSRPTGLEYIAETLVNNDYDVDLVDLTLEEKPDEVIKERIKDNNYYAIGISIFNTQWDNARDSVDFFLPGIKDMITKIKGLSDAPVILGGYGFSMQPKDILEYVGADFGISGCGILAIVTLLIKIDKGEVQPGTVFKQEPEKYLYFGFKRNTVNYKKYPQKEHIDYTATYISTKDGCIGRCYHCPHTSTKLKLRDPDKVITEIKNLITQGVKTISFIHDMMNVPVDHARKICEGMTGLSIRWTADIYPLKKFLPTDLADSMKHSGMTRATIGTRTIGSDRMLEVYRQGYSTKDMEYATKLFKERGIKTSWFIGFGAPGESKETIDETFTLIDEVEPDEVSIISKARIYKNTELASIAEKEGIISSTDNLLEPIYYPLSSELRDYIFQEAEKRENCTVFY